MKDETESCVVNSSQNTVRDRREDKDKNWEIGIPAIVLQRVPLEESTCTSLLRRAPLFHQISSPLELIASNVAPLLAIVTGLTEPDPHETYVRKHHQLSGLWCVAIFGGRHGLLSSLFGIVKPNEGQTRGALIYKGDGQSLDGDERAHVELSKASALRQTVAPNTVDVGWKLYGDQAGASIQKADGQTLYSH